MYIQKNKKARKTEPINVCLSMHEQVLEKYPDIYN